MPKKPRWFSEIVFAGYVTGLVTVLYYRWFALRDRYEVFLYYHDMGPGFDTAPFGAVTVGRYAMTGLVAAGAVMVLYLAANLLLGRVFEGYQAPAWRRVWMLCAAPLALIVPGIVMTVNAPTMPLPIALQIVAALLAGLGLALHLGQTAADRPGALLLWMIDGAGLTTLLLSLTAAEDIPRWLQRGTTGPISVIVIVTVLGLGLLTGMTILYRLWKKAPIPDAVSWLAAGAGPYYLLLPLMHHLFFSTDAGSFLDPGYFSYITSADNYFAGSALFQVMVWALLAGGVWGITRLRCGLRGRHNTAPDTA